MKSTKPVSGPPAPSIEACLAEATAQAAAGRSAKRTAAATRSGPDRLVATSPAPQAAAQRLLASRAPRTVAYVLHVAPGPGWPAVLGYAATAQPKAPTTATTTSGTSSKSTTATSTSGEWGFLNNTHISIESKRRKPGCASFAGRLSCFPGFSRRDYPG